MQCDFVVVLVDCNKKILLVLLWMALWYSAIFGLLNACGAMKFKLQYAALYDTYDRMLAKL
jgi:hypothetical protein